MVMARLHLKMSLQDTSYRFDIMSRSFEQASHPTMPVFMTPNVRNRDHGVVKQTNRFDIHIICITHFSINRLMYHVMHIRLAFLIRCPDQEKTTKDYPIEFDNRVIGVIDCCKRFIDKPS